MKVAILLASFNGDRFIAEQLESLREQTFKDWELFNRDDGSTDRTLGILETFAKYDARIHLLPADGMLLGPTQSFTALLTHALNKGFDYFFFCDQDDVWLPQKIERMLEVLKTEEGPFAVHSDLEVCDAFMKRVRESAKKGIPTDLSEAETFPKLLCQNFVTGCALAINRPLAEKVLPISADPLMHDWWVALVACATGKLHFIHESLVRYRQHGANASGPGLQLGWAAGFKKFASQRADLDKLMERRFRQIVALRDHLEKFGDSPALALLHDLTRRAGKGTLSFLWGSLTQGLRMLDVPRSLAYYWILMSDASALRKVLHSGPEAESVTEAG